MAKDFNYVKRKWASYIPFFGPVVSKYFKFNMYNEDAFEEWIRDKLSKKGVRTFNDFAKLDGTFKVNLLCTDLARRRILSLPVDMIDIDGHTTAKDLDVAKAVRIAAYGHSAQLIDDSNPLLLVRMWRWLRGTNVVHFKEAELNEHAYNSSPVFHLKVIRDRPTASSTMQYSSSCSSVFISEDEQFVLKLEPELHFVEIDDMLGRHLVIWEDLFKMGQRAAIDMMQHDFEIDFPRTNKGKREAQHQHTTQESPKKMPKKYNGSTDSQENQQLRRQKLF